MAQRTITDARGTVWSIWDVHPATAAETVRIVLPEAMRTGWLAFETADERRRLLPIPEGWEAFSDLELEQLCRRATVVPRNRRGT